MSASRVRHLSAVRVCKLCGKKFAGKSVVVVVVVRRRGGGGGRGGKGRIRRRLSSARALTTQSRSSVENFKTSDGTSRGKSAVKLAPRNGVPKNKTKRLWKYAPKNMRLKRKTNEMFRTPSVAGFQIGPARTTRVRPNVFVAIRTSLFTVIFDIPENAVSTAE